MELSSPLICFNVWSLDISVVSGCFKISLSGTWAVLFRHWAELSRYLPASIISPKFAEIIWYCHPPRLQTRDTSRANKHPQLCIIRQPSSSSTQVWVEQLAADPRSQGIKTWETWGGSFARSSGRRWQEVSASSSGVSVAPCRHLTCSVFCSHQTPRKVIHKRRSGETRHHHGPCAGWLSSAAASSLPQST